MIQSFVEASDINGFKDERGSDKKEQRELAYKKSEQVTKANERKDDEGPREGIMQWDWSQSTNLEPLIH